MTNWATLPHEELIAFQVARQLLPLEESGERRHNLVIQHQSLGFEAALGRSRITAEPLKLK